MREADARVLDQAKFKGLESITDERVGRRKRLVRPRGITADQAKQIVRLLERLKKSKRAKKIGADLTEADLRGLLHSQNYRCAITGLVFSDVAARGPGYQMSLDRIDSAQSYHMGNVRFVLFAVNMAMGDWGLETYLELATAAKLHLATNR